MIDNSDTFTVQLKETCKLTGARWAVWIKRTGQRWDMLAVAALRKPQQSALLDFIQNPETTTWLAGALSSGRVRSRRTGASVQTLGCQRIYGFPHANEPALILAGSDNMDATAQTFFRILALGRSAEAGPRDSEEDKHQSRLLDLELQASYDPDGVLKRVLEFMAPMVPCDAAYLTVRSGDFFRIESVWKCSPGALGLDIPISTNKALIGMVENRQGLILGDVRQEPSFSRVIAAIDRPVKCYLRAPFVVGRRVIGDAVFLSYRLNRFKPADLKRVSQQMERLSPAIENAIVFREATRYLQRFALLNDIASAASGSNNTDEIARVVVGRMQPIFRTKHVAVLLVSDDRKSFREYGKVADPKACLNISVENSLVGYVVESGKPVRVGDVRDAPRFLQRHEAVHSAMAAPLKYQSEVIGAIELESQEPNAFSEKDEQLLILIASQLAGLFENARLNQETRQRNQELQEHIKAQQATESQLIRSARLAAVGEMAAGVAHELNNPLTTIIGFIELALEELPADLAQRADLDLVQREAQRARGVVRRLLDFSRQSENVRLPVDLNDLVNDVLALLQHQIQNGCVQSELDLMAELPMVFADPDQIKQVLVNLVQNALLAMPEGGELGIKTEVYVEGERNRGVRLSVRDTGEGIALENQNRIFEPFFTTRPVGSGTGLGLSVSYGIVTAHRGWIDFESQPGQGSCFTVWLPVEETEFHE